MSEGQRDVDDPRENFIISCNYCFVSWLSGKKIALAGFLTAVPLTTLIALAFSQLEWKDPQ